MLDNEEKAILNQVNAELEEANINYNRALKLSEKGNISQSALDNRLMNKKNYQEKLMKLPLNLKIIGLQHRLMELQVLETLVKVHLLNQVILLLSYTI